MGNPKRPSQIPTAEDWVGYESDLDVRDAFRMMFGKTTEQVQEYFGDSCSIDRADEMLFMPRRAFQYYVFAFADFLRTERARGDSESASPFLHLLLSRERRDPGSVRSIYPFLTEVVEFVASHQEYFEADPSIYGSFRDLASQLDSLCGSLRSREA